MPESTEHLAGRIVREAHFIKGRMRAHGKVTDAGYDFTRNYAEFVYELPTGELFEVQVRSWSEVTDAD